MPLRVLCLLLLFLFGCHQDEAPSAAADLPDTPSALVEEAALLMEQGRPWRAALAMRKYRAAVDELSPDHRLLAARAEAGWENWPAVHELLEGEAGLDSLGQGIASYLRARGRDAVGQTAGAIEDYRAFLVTPSEGFADERAAAELRLGLALLRADAVDEGQAVLADVADAMGDAGRWVALLAAEARAATGDPEPARALAQQYGSGLIGVRARRALVDAAEVGGDMDAAQRLAREGFGWARSDATRAEFKVLEGRIALAQGNQDAGRTALRRAIALDAAGMHGQAAAALLREGAMTPADHLASARVYAGMGLHEDAARDFRAWLDAEVGSAVEQSNVRLDLARSLIADQQYDAVPDVLEPLGDDRTARDLRASALSRRGETEQAAAIYRQLAAEQQGSDDGAAALYFAADAYQQGGNADAARPMYREVADAYPGTRWMGLALMRLAGLYFLEGAYDEAAALWDRYRQRYPNGEFALQSTYWAGRAHEAAGDAEAAADLFRQVRRADRGSYYALIASERLGESFWPLPMGASPAPDPAAQQQVAAWMAPVDRLREGGVYDVASAEVDRVLDRSGRGQAVRYALAEALIARGYSQQAIRIGLGLQSRGYNPRLLRILYPYPYRALIEAEAEEQGFASAIAAALVRQESMFTARITSHVGARGLMQIMPATGAELATAAGLDAWDPAFLYHPEIAAHLGMGYIAEGLEAYGGSLPATFAAYNAGPHQVDQWRSFPEFEADQELFTERIPFSETRDYVKKLTVNRAIYEGLYGEDATLR